jgi:hypothetical protein
VVKSRRSGDAIKTVRLPAQHHLSLIGGGGVVIFDQESSNPFPKPAAKMTVMSTNSSIASCYQDFLGESLSNCV